MTEAHPAVIATVLTHNGGHRPANEDAVVVGSSTFTSVSMSQPHTLIVPVPPDEPVVVAVADGLGGHQAGEVAAAHVVRRLAGAAGSLKSRDDIAALLATASAELTDTGSRDPGQLDMGTTVVGLLLSADQIVWFNVGDSRAYRVSGGHLGQMSVDDTPTAAFAQAGESPEPTSIVTQAIGTSSPAPSAHTGVESVTGDSAYLLCSDGLSDLVSLTEIERILADHPGHDQAAVKALWAAAMNSGGHDNITIVLVRVQPPGPASRGS